MTTYTCGICQTTPDQVSHHRAHISTQKHKDKKEIFELKLRNVEHDQLHMEYGTTDVLNIVEQLETVLFKPKNDTSDYSSHFSARSSHRGDRYTSLVDMCDK